MNAMKELIAQIIKKIDEKTKPTGSSYTGKVTRVEGQTAYVQFDGSDINDTPVRLSIGAKPGDEVRVRVEKGRAWLTGNDTSPPNDSSDVLKALENTSEKLEKRIKDSSGNTSLIRQTAERIMTEVRSIAGSVSSLQQRADQIEISVRGKVDTSTYNSGMSGKMATDMANRASAILIDSGLIKFESNTIVIDSSQFTLDANGNAVFKGSLSAATGSFAGSLSAATGTFKGAVSFQWTGYTFLENVYIGDKTKGAPIIITGNSDGLGVVETAVQAGYIEVTQNGGNQGASLSPQGVFPWSDRRLKDNIRTLDEKVALALRPVSFRYKDEEPSALHYGFIAQEVRGEIPTAVSKNSFGYLTLNYLELIAPTLALAQQNARRIDELEKELKALKEVDHE